MRLISTCFVTLSLAITSFVVAHVASPGSVSARLVSDVTLGRTFGTNTTVGGGPSSSYSCNNVNATGNNQFTKDGCSALTTIPKGAQCVDCPQVSGFGYTSGTATKIYFVGVIDCTNNGKGSNLETADCIMGAAGHGVCDVFTPTGQCTGSFNQYDVQTVTPP